MAEKLSIVLEALRSHEDPLKYAEHIRRLVELKRRYSTKLKLKSADRKYLRIIFEEIGWEAPQ